MKTVTNLPWRLSGWVSLQTNRRNAEKVQMTTLHNYKCYCTYIFYVSVEKKGVSFARLGTSSTQTVAATTASVFDTSCMEREPPTLRTANERGERRRGRGRGKAGYDFFRLSLPLHAPANFLMELKRDSPTSRKEKREEGFFSSFLSLSFFILLLPPLLPPPPPFFFRSRRWLIWIN